MFSALHPDSVRIAREVHFPPLVSRNGQTFWQVSIDDRSRILTRFGDKTWVRNVFSIDSAIVGARSKWNTKLKTYRIPQPPQELVCALLSEVSNLHSAPAPLTLHTMPVGSEPRRLVMFGSPPSILRLDSSGGLQSDVAFFNMDILTYVALYKLGCASKNWIWLLLEDATFSGHISVENALSMEKPNMPWAQRLLYMQQYVDSLQHPNIRVQPHVQIDTEDEMAAHLLYFQRQGMRVYCSRPLTEAAFSM